MSSTRPFSADPKARPAAGAAPPTHAAGTAAARVGTTGTATAPFAAWWFDRFRLSPAGPGAVHFRDMLMPAGRSADASRFDTLTGRPFEIACFQHGFARAAYGAALATVNDRPQHAGDTLFWQFPCRTEGDAWDRHAVLAEPEMTADAMHVYLGLPWATWIDKGRKRAWGDAGPAPMEAQLRLLGVRLAGLRHALARLGVRLKVHTVCQHIYWPDLLAPWGHLGITDLWLSHCPEQQEVGAESALTLHPWRLYAVNVEDTARRAGLQVGRDPANKTLLASFIGTHMPHYLSDARLRLRALAGQPGFDVQVTQDKWHFEDVVYRHQVHHEPLAGNYAVDESVSRYNSLLSDSVFSLCPVGAGPNTLRLWESLAVGSVPVLLGPPPRMPQGGTLPDIDWGSIVLRIADEQIAALPQILRSMPMEEVRRRQQLGMQAFAQVQAQRCF